ncbi:MAG: hypothetical protein GY906_39120 [bacterium]|nr:hypothetical protein [bacterium]
MMHGEDMITYGEAKRLAQETWKEHEARFSRVWIFFGIGGYVLGFICGVTIGVMWM